MDVLEIGGVWGYSRRYSIDGVDQGYADTSILSITDNYVSTGQRVEEGVHKGEYIYQWTATITVNPPAGTHFQSLSFENQDWLTVGFNTNVVTQTTTYLAYSGHIRYLSGEVRANFISDSPHPPSDHSAISLILTGVPQNVGSLIGGGLRTGPVDTTTTYTVIAELLAAMKGRYRFAYWLDDQNVKHNEKSFSKTFTFKEGYTPQNPEVITFTAYFIACTGLILRSSSSGLILRGKANRILRDE